MTNYTRYHTVSVLLHISDRVYEQMKRTGVFQSTGAIAEAAAEAAGGDDEE